jgi:hypothetical protein
LKRRKPLLKNINTTKIALIMTTMMLLKVESMLLENLPEERRNSKRPC